MGLEYSMITMRFDHAEEAFSSVLRMDKGQPYSVTINLVFISLSQQIPHALREFLDLELVWTTTTTMWAGGSEDNTFSPLTIARIIFHGTDIYVDNFI